jgi:peptidoglycan/LPS O-acetylase OafA/YrhL
MSTVEQSVRQRTPFLPYLEGVRGVAALYVVLFHVHQFFEHNYAPFGPSAALMPFRGQFLLYGHYAVSVFIVISGFVLSIPVAVRGSLNGGWQAFFKRRARRLLPAFYAALTLSLPFYLFHIHQLQTQTTLVAVAVQYVSHALLVYDFFDRTLEGINAPMWSVAVEIQIYIAFVFILLPVFRKIGFLGSIAVAFLIGCIPTIYGAARHLDPYPLEHASFWMLGLFALGSAAAFIAYDAHDRYVMLRSKMPWKLIAVAGAASFVWIVTPLYDDRYHRSSFLPLDALLGVAISATFIAIANDQNAGRTSLVARFFAWRPLVLLGTFSYSLYLIHYPIVLVVMTAIYPLPPLAKVSIAYFVLVPAIVVLAYFFAKLFELPFVSSVRREADRAVIAHELPEASPVALRAVPSTDA